MQTLHIGSHDRWYLSENEELGAVGSSIWPVKDTLYDLGCNHRDTIDYPCDDSPIELRLIHRMAILIRALAQVPSTLRFVRPCLQPDMPRNGWICIPDGSAPDRQSTADCSKLKRGKEGIST